MKRIASRGKLVDTANNNNNNKQTPTPNQNTNTANPFKRLWSTGSDKSKDNKAMPYPEQIIVGQVDPKIERQIERRREKDEIEYWKAEAEKYKEKAIKLEKSIEYFEEKLTLLELQVSNNNNGSSSGLDDSNSSPPTLLLQGSSPKRADGLSKSLPSNPQSSSPPPSPPKINTQKIISLQRRDEIVLELITEMERVITLRTAERLADPSSSGDDNGDIDIHTSTLEEIVERTLAAGAQDYSNKKKSSKSSSSKSNKGGDNGEGGEKKKHKSSSSKRRSSNKTYVNELYQLSCKHCVGQNFVGTTKGDLKEKVKDHYGVVWQLVSQAYGKGPKNEDWKNNCGAKKKGSKSKGDVKDEEAEEEKQEDFDHVFRASSFSHHIAEHCRECNSESKVLSWCAKNVKVEKIAASANSF